MATRTGTGRKKRTVPSSLEEVAADAGISVAQYQELEETFKLFDTKGAGSLSTKKLCLAMRTLGFEGSMKDVLEMIKAKSSHSPRSSSRKHKEPKQTHNTKTTTIHRHDPSAHSQETRTRQSTRTAAVAQRTGQKSKYVDSDVNNSSDDDDDPEDDVYQDMKTHEHESGHDNVESESSEEPSLEDLYYTMDDFVNYMAPCMAQHDRSELSKIFQLFDSQGRGFIQLEDLKRIAGELSLPWTEQELREMIDEADKQGTGAVTEEEFARIMKKAGF